MGWYLSPFPSTDELKSLVTKFKNPSNESVVANSHLGIFMCGGEGEPLSSKHVEVVMENKMFHVEHTKTLIQGFGGLGRVREFLPNKKCVSGVVLGVQMTVFVLITPFGGRAGVFWLFLLDGLVSVPVTRSLGNEPDLALVRRL